MNALKEVKKVVRDEFNGMPIRRQNLSGWRQGGLQDKKRLLDQAWAIQREPMVAKVFGGGELGRKLAKYVVALENDVPDAKLEITEEDVEKSKRSREKSVKPKRNRRTVQRARKTKPDNVDKPLKANDIEQKSESGISPDQSSPVKPGQTNLAPANEAPAASFPNLNPNLPTPEDHPETRDLQIRPIPPIAPISPEEESDAREFQRLTASAEKGG